MTLHLGTEEKLHNCGNYFHI